MTQDSIVWGIYRHIFPLCVFSLYFVKMQVWYTSTYLLPMYHVGCSKTKKDFPMVPIAVLFHDKN